MSGDSDTFLNDAFISYNGKDADFARLLESALEKYRPPKQLTDRTGHPRVFRYEGDMVGTDYDAAIEKHLGESRFLIVICSPAARASRYVNDEIERFARHRPVANIIPVLLTGQPNNASGREEELAFPEALVRLIRMPLGIDYRGFTVGRDKPARGRYESSWYQLLANLYEVSRDDMEQRERSRRLRRRTYWATGATIVAAVVSVLAVVAWIQRGVAIEAQAVAEMRLLSVQAEREERNNLPEPALVLAAASVRKSLDNPALHPMADAVSLIYREAVKSAGSGLTGFRHEWPVQRSTEPWAAGDASGRWLITGNYGGNEAIAWDLQDAYPPGSGQLLLDAPDNYSHGAWADNIQAYVNEQFPDQEGEWLLPKWDEQPVMPPLEPPAGLKSARPVRLLSNPAWVVWQSDDRYWLSRTDSPQQAPVEVSYRLEQDDGWGFDPARIFVTADNQWLIILGGRTHRLIDLSSQISPPVYQSHVTAQYWPNNSALYTAHVSGEVFRWNTSGTRQQLSLETNRQDGFRHIMVAGDEHRMLLQHGAGDWNLWVQDDAGWQAHFPDDDESRFELSEMLNQTMQASTHRIGNPYDPVASSMSGFSSGAYFEPANTLNIPTADGMVTWDTTNPFASRQTVGANPRAELNKQHEVREDGSLVSVVSPDGRWRVGSAGLEGALISDTQALGSVWEDMIPWPQFASRYYSAVYFFSPDLRWLVMGSGYSGRDDCGMPIDLYRLDLNSTEPMSSLTPLKGGLNGAGDEVKCPVVEFSSGGNWLLSDGTLWNLRTEADESEPVFLPGPGLTISPDEKWVAVEVKQTSGMKVVMLPLEPGTVAALACRKAGRNLTASEWRKLFAGQAYEPLCRENF